MESHNNSFIVPGSQKRKRAIARLGVILSNLAILGTLASFATALSFLGIITFYIIMFFIIIITMFTMLANPEFMALFSNADQINSFMVTAATIAPYALYSTIGAAFVSLFFLGADKNWQKAKSSKVVSIVCMVLCILLLGVYYFIAHQFSA